MDLTDYRRTDIGWLDRMNPQPHVAGGAPARGGWIEAERVIHDHELVLFDGATFALRAGGRTLVLEGPAFAIVPPGQPHASWNATERPGFRRWVHFDWDWRGAPPSRLFTYLPGHVDRGSLRAAPAWLPGGILHGVLANAASVQGLHARLCGLLAGGPGDCARARAVLLDLLLELFLPPPLGARAVPTPGLADRARALLAAEALKPIARGRRLAEVLRATGCSYEHVCRVFRREGGMTPHAYVMRLRVERAKVLLQEGRSSVRAVAAAVGFGSHAHFSSVFREQTGCTPSAFAARTTGDAGAASPGGSVRAASLVP